MILILETTVGLSLFNLLCSNYIAYNKAAYRLRFSSSSSNHRIQRLFFLLLFFLLQKYCTRYNKNRSRGRRSRNRLGTLRVTRRHGPTSSSSSIIIRRLYRATVLNRHGRQSVHRLPQTLQTRRKRPGAMRCVQ